LEERGKRSKDTRGGVPTYTVCHYNDLDELLGNQWHMRVLNINGDFSYAILDTISFHLTKGRPIIEYEVARNEDGTYKFQEVFLEQNSYLVFNFIRGDGIKSELDNYI
jgi:hypothetical protein